MSTTDRDSSRDNSRDNSRDSNRQSQQNSSRNRANDAEVDYLVVTYDITPVEAREVITVCGCSDRGKLDDYMEGQGITKSSDRGHSGNTR